MNSLFASRWMPTRTATGRRRHFANAVLSKLIRFEAALDELALNS
jgi:hypothetical protein